MKGQIAPISEDTEVQVSVWRTGLADNAYENPSERAPIMVLRTAKDQETMHLFQNVSFKNATMIYNHDRGLKSRDEMTRVWIAARAGDVTVKTHHNTEEPLLRYLALLNAGEAMGEALVWRAE